MDLPQQNDVGEEPVGWGVSRRRKRIAVVVGVVVLAVAFDSTPDTSQGPTTDASSKVTVDEFDRIEALLATSENQRVQGRGPTVEVPSDLAIVDERPDFDFDFNVFDDVVDPSRSRVSADKEIAAGATATDPQLIGRRLPDDRKAPNRDSFEDLNRVTQLQIPDRMALGNGQRLTVDGVSASEAINRHDDPNVTFQLSKVESGLQSLSVPDKPTQEASVRIVTADVTASKVTRFAPASNIDLNESSERIRFVGTILPVFRHPSQK